MIYKSNCMLRGRCSNLVLTGHGFMFSYRFLFCEPEVKRASCLPSPSNLGSSVNGSLPHNVHPVSHLRGKHHVTQVACCTLRMHNSGGGALHSLRLAVGLSLHVGRCPSDRSLDPLLLLTGTQHYPVTHSSAHQIAASTPCCSSPVLDTALSHMPPPVRLQPKAVSSWSSRPIEGLVSLCPNT